MEIHRVDLDTILEARVPESEASSADPAEDTMLASLFSTTYVPPPPQQKCAKRHQTRDEDESRALKEHHELEAARRASLSDGKAHQLRVIEVVDGASSTRVVEAERSTIDGDVIAEETTNGFPTLDRAGYRQSDPPAY